MSSRFASVRILSVIDDIITNNLVDNVLINTKCSKVHKESHDLYKVKFKPEILAAIIRKTCHYKNVKDYKPASLAIVSLYKKELLDVLSADDIHTYFVDHLTRYLAIFSQSSAIELVNTYRYKNMPEVTVIASRHVQKNEILTMVEGSWGVMNEKENEEFKKNGSDFSVMYSSQYKTYNVFLGPPRFINHDCNNNVEYHRDGSRVYLKAVRSIKKGEEIFTSYGNEYFKHKVEMNGEIIIKNDCKCDSCLSGLTETKPYDTSKRAAKSDGESKMANLTKQFPFKNSSRSKTSSSESTLSNQSKESKTNFFRPQLKVENTRFGWMQKNAEEPDVNHPFICKIISTDFLDDISSYTKKGTTKLNPSKFLVRKSNYLETGMPKQKLEFLNFSKNIQCCNCKISTLQCGYDFDFENSSHSYIQALLKTELHAVPHLCSRCFKHYEIFVNQWPVKTLSSDVKEEDDLLVKRFGVILSDTKIQEKEISDQEKENEQEANSVSESKIHAKTKHKKELNSFDFEEVLYMYKDHESPYYKLAVKTDTTFVSFRNFTTLRPEFCKNMKKFVDYLEVVADTPFFIENEDWQVVSELMLGDVKLDCSSALKIYICGGLSRTLELWFNVKKYTGLERISNRIVGERNSLFWNFNRYFEFGGTIADSNGYIKYNMADDDIIGELIWLEHGDFKAVSWPGIVVSTFDHWKKRSDIVSVNIYHFDGQITNDVPLVDIVKFDPEDPYTEKMSKLKDFNEPWVRDAFKCYETGYFSQFKGLLRYPKLKVKHEKFSKAFERGDFFGKGQIVKVHAWSGKNFSAKVLANFGEGLVKVQLLENGEIGLVDAIRVVASQ
eukprot:NODE_19_length_47148_cov_1.447810.p1 type:complete len:837 gc:universal NODE_19_length_47148_cov_1.447810:40961-38451(-)